MVSLTSVFGSSSSQPDHLAEGNGSVGQPDSTSYAPLAVNQHPSVPTPRVTLPIPMGKVAVQTALDMQYARSQAAFNPAKIEEVVRDSRIDNETRVGVVSVLARDEVFGDWKKKM
jgi:acyl-CoA oxidase